MIEIVFQARIKHFLVTPIDETRKPGVLPHAVNPILASAIAIVAHQLVLSVVGATSVCSAIVVVGNVIIPQRSPIEQGILLILIEISGEISIDITTHFGSDVPIDERRGVHPSTIAFLRICEFAAVKNRLKVLHILPNIRILFPRDVLLVGIMNADGYTILRCGKTVAIIKTINLQQISTCDVTLLRQREILLCDVDTMRAHIHMVADLVIAQKRAVQCDIHKLMGRIVLQSQEIAHQKGDSIAHQRLITRICQQCPLLRLRISLSEELLLLLELDSIRLFLQSPRGVAPTAYLHAFILSHHIFLIHIIHGGINISRLTGDGHIVDSLNIDMGQIGHSLIGLSVYSHQHKKQKSDCKRIFSIHKEENLATKVVNSSQTVKKNKKIIATFTKSRTFASRFISRGGENHLVLCVDSIFF